MEAGVYELELFAVEEMELHVKFVLVHFAVQNQSIGNGAVEGEANSLQSLPAA